MTPMLATAVEKSKIKTSIKAKMVSRVGSTSFDLQKYV